MRIIILGLGIQGHKRKQVAMADCVATVDPLNTDADYSDLKAVPLSAYDAVLVCTPDQPKIEILTYLLSNKKHVLVEKPLFAHLDDDIEQLERLAQQNQVICYTAYNHRFEPHFVTMKDLIQSNELGTIYHCRLFYGNGTARLVRNSNWRDQGGGVLPDLGSHLLDTLNFWFETQEIDIKVRRASCFENQSPDHVILAGSFSKITIDLEMTLLSWRNHFTCDIFAEKGSAHIRSLCKWGPTTFTHRKRTLPSGRPTESTTTLSQPDPTWEKEYEHFKHLCQSRTTSSLAKDRWLNGKINSLTQTALQIAA